MDAYKWTNGQVLRVRFLDANASDKLKTRVFSTGSQWSQYANLTFRTAQPNEKAEIRITFHDNGHWSRIGNSSLVGSQTAASMSLSIDDSTADSELSRVVLHEFGHAIGLVHEHQQPGAQAIIWNEQAVIDYYKGSPNFWSAAQTRANVLTHYNAANFKGPYTQFDKDSIMCYPIPAGLADVTVGWNRKLSATDKTFIGDWYKKGVASLFRASDVAAVQALYPKDL